MPGQHWVAFFLLKNNVIALFDSFGLCKINNLYFRKFIGKRKVAVNRRQFQSNFSAVCGQYCCVFAYFFCRGFRFKTIMNRFKENNFHDNDKTVELLFKSIFHSWILPLKMKEEEEEKLEQLGNRATTTVGRNSLRKKICQSCKARNKK